MASLIEELISVLRSEDEIYQNLIPIEEAKTKSIISNDLQALQEITEQEQQVVEQINVLERKREEVIVNIGTVMNQKPESLNIKIIVEFLEKQPKQQKELCSVHDSLKKTLKRLVQANDQNKSLIVQSLEMIEFNMNLIQSTRMSPGTNNYTKKAAQWEPEAVQTGMFDAKQ